MSTFFISPSQYIRIFLYLPSKNNLKSTKRSKALHIYLRLSPFFGSNNLTMNCFLPRTTLLLLLHCTATATAAAAADVPAVLLPSILLFSFRLDFCKEERNYTTRKRSWHNSNIMPVVSVSSASSAASASSTVSPPINHFSVISCFSFISCLIFSSFTSFINYICSINFINYVSFFSFVISFCSFLGRYHSWSLECIRRRGYQFTELCKKRIHHACL